MKGFLRSKLILTFVTLAMIATAIVIPLSGSVIRSYAASDRTVTVMTQNMDEGTDFGPIFTATSFSGFVSAVGATYKEVQAGNIPERAVAIAHEIRQTQPTLVGLQEVSQWLTGPLGSPPAKTVVYDQLQSLLDALAQQGLHYAPVGISKNIDVEAPSNLGFDVRLIDRDVLLARTDLADVTLSNIQVQHFAHLLVVHTVVAAVTILRGWISVDVTIKDHHTFRFLTTHLESLSSTVQVAQGNELVQGPANTSLPVVFAGDFNSNAGSNAGSGRNQTPTYGNLIAAGFVDAWSATNPNDPGYTWPLHLEDPLTASATPVDRIDLVLLLNKVRAKEAELVGNEPADKTPSGLWPSDHAGVVATVRIQRSGMRVCGRDEQALLRLTPLNEADSLFSSIEPEQRQAAKAEFFPGMPKGWGLTFMINSEQAPTGRSAGSLAWAGLASSYFWIDLARGLGGVYATQVLPFADHKALPLFFEFEKTIYQG